MRRLSTSSLLFVIAVAFIQNTSSLRVRFRFNLARHATKLHFSDLAPPSQPKSVMFDDEDNDIPPPPPSSGSGEWTEWDTDNYVVDDFEMDSADDDGDAVFLKIPLISPTVQNIDISNGGDEVEYDLEGDLIEKPAWLPTVSAQKSSSTTSAPENWTDWSEEANYFDDEPDDSNDDYISEKVAEEFLSDPTRLKSLVNFASTSSLPPSSDIFARSWERTNVDETGTGVSSNMNTVSGAVSELFPAILETNRLLGALDAKTSADATKTVQLVEKLSAQVDALKLLLAGSIGTSIAVLVVLAGK